MYNLSNILTPSHQPCFLQDLFEGCFGMNYKVKQISRESWKFQRCVNYTCLDEMSKNAMDLYTGITMGTLFLSVCENVPLLSHQSNTLCDYTLPIYDKLNIKKFWKVTSDGPCTIKPSQCLSLSYIEIIDLNVAMQGILRFFIAIFWYLLSVILPHRAVQRLHRHELQSQTNFQKIMTIPKIYELHMTGWNAEEHARPACPLVLLWKPTSCQSVKMSLDNVLWIKMYFTLLYHIDQDIDYYHALWFSSFLMNI